MILVFTIIVTTRFIPVPIGKQPNNGLVALKLSQGIVLRQFFTNNSDYLDGIGIVFVIPKHRVSGKLTMTLSAHSSSERRIAEIEVPVSQLQPDRETAFRFFQRHITPGEMLVLRLHATSSAKEAVACLLTKQNYWRNGKLLIKGKRLNYSLVFQTYHPQSLSEIFSRVRQGKTKFYSLIDVRVLPPLLLLLLFLAGWWLKKLLGFQFISEQIELDYDQEF